MNPAFTASPYVTPSMEGVDKACIGVIPAKEAVSQFRLDLSLRFEMTKIRAVLHVISTEGRNLELVDVSINHLFYFMRLFF